LRDVTWGVLDGLCGRDRLTWQAHPRAVRYLGLSPDGFTLVTAGDDPGVKLWDTATGRLRAAVTPPGPAPAPADGPLAPFPARGKWLALQAAAGEVRLWDLSAPREQAVLRGHRGPLLCMAFSPDARVLATAGADRELKLWDVAAGKEKGRLE